jgi:hypothetical protein
MKTVEYTVQLGTLCLSDLEQIFSELANNGCSLMIRSDAARQSNLFTCAISVIENPERSVRRDAGTMTEAIMLCLRAYLNKPV